MGLYIASLNSGSNGNCYYVGNEEEAILVDAGICCREIEKRLKHLSLPAGRIRAIFISHEHSDHIRGLEVFSKKYRLPVYITPPTVYHGGLSLHASQVVSFCCGEKIRIGNLEITPFSKNHDASDPYSFIVSDHQVTIGVFTDLGKCCDKLVQYFRLCDAAFLESNYDEAMLVNGRYPWHLKQRIRGGKGHLSNTEALNLFLQHRRPQMQLLLLSHLSANNNRVEIVEELFNRHANGVRMVVASRHAASELFFIPASEALQNVQAAQQMSFDFTC
jgi:phosphoribosyl 1,2-cyclic phosphodiesterase